MYNIHSIFGIDNKINNNRLIFGGNEWRLEKLTANGDWEGDGWLRHFGQREDVVVVKAWKEKQKWDAYLVDDSKLYYIMFREWK